MEDNLIILYFKMISIKKRAQGMSLTTIIVAALALIVLIVLIAIFSGKIGIFSKESANTAESATSSICNRVHEEGKRGFCKSAGENCPTGIEQAGVWTDCGAGVSCCI